MTHFIDIERTDRKIAGLDGGSIAGLPDLARCDIPKRGKHIYEMTIKSTKYTKLKSKKPNYYKIYQHLPLQDPAKLTKIGISCL
jgi:hypothetical protein